MMAEPDYRVAQLKFVRGVAGVRGKVVRRGSWCRKARRRAGSPRAAASQPTTWAPRATRFATTASQGAAADHLPPPQSYAVPGCCLGLSRERHWAAEQLGAHL